MRIWFESCSNYLKSDETHLQFGVVSYWHKRKEWRGFTVSVLFIERGFSFNYVNDFKAYTEVMNRRYTPYSQRRRKREPNSTI